jgi:1,4-dihydroxy-2-naphthoyl-CoA hydrolase
VIRPHSQNDFKAFGEGKFPGWLGVDILKVSNERVSAQLVIEERHFAPNGYLHAAVVIGLADTACGYGCIAGLPDGARGFTTIELKTNFIGTVDAGTLECEAELAHGGRTTQVWDAVVSTRSNSKKLALFRATQLILYE